MSFRPIVPPRRSGPGALFQIGGSGVAGGERILGRHTVLAGADVGLVHMDVDTIPMSEPRTRSSAKFGAFAAGHVLHAADPLLL
jgi:hypothetical protein